MSTESVAVAAANIASGTSGTCAWVIDGNGKLTVRPTSGSMGVLDAWTGNGAPWLAYRDSIKSAVFEGAVRAQTCQGMFYACNYLSSLELTGLDTSGAANMSDMFAVCINLKAVDLSGFDTGFATDMSRMFSGCVKLSDVDASGFDTRGVEAMEEMFQGCVRLRVLDLSSFDMGNVADAVDMFRSCGKLRKVTLGPKFAFKEGCGFPELKEGSFLTGAWESSSGLILASGELAGGYDGATMAGEWRAQMKADAVGDDDAVAILYAEGDMVFQRGPEADPDKGEVLAKWTRFEDENSVPWLDSESGSCDLFFENAKRVSFKDIIRPISTAKWFSGEPGYYTHDDGSFRFDSHSLIESIDLANLDTSRVVRMDHMFHGCKGVAFIDLSGLDTSHVTDMSYLFAGCEALSAIDLSGFRTSCVTSMLCMFEGCVNLAAIDVSGFRTSKVTKMAHMFYGCASLESVDLSSFDMAKVEYPAQVEAKEPGVTFKHYLGAELMFSGCSKLTSMTLGKKVTFAGRTRSYWPALPGLDDSLAWFGPDGKRYSSEKLCEDYNGAVMAGTYVVRSITKISSASITGLYDKSYTGKELAPKPIVKAGGKKLSLGTDYTLSYSNNINAGIAKVTISGIGSYTGSVTKEFAIKSAQLSSLSLKAASATYDEKAHKPAVKAVKAGSLAVPASSKSGYSVTYWRGSKQTDDFKSGGTITVKVAGAGNFTGTKTATFKINPKANPMSAKAVAKTVKLPKGKKALAKATAVSGAVKFTKAAQGKVTYAKVAKGSAKCLSIDKKTGKVTVAKGTKAGTYKLKATVKAAGDKNHKAKTQTLTLTVRVKK